MEALTNMVTITHYAELCGMCYNTIKRRLLTGELERVVIDGITFIDTEKFPPQKQRTDETVD